MADNIENFVWRGSDKNGKQSKGEITAASMAEAKQMLRRQGLSAKSVRKKPKPLFSFGDKKVTANDVSLLSRQLATMLNAGVTLIQSLEMIGQGSPKPSVRNMMAAITAEVQSGNPLNSTLRKYPRQFDDLYCDLVETGEQSGALETIFERIAVYKEKSEALKSKIKKAMFYPIAVLVVAFIVTVILLVFVVPTFEEIFSGFGAELPVFTQMVLKLSNFVQSYGLFIFAAFIVGVILFVRAHRASPKIRDRMDAFLLKMPIVGELLKKACVARFARTLSTTFAAGVPLISALDSAAGAAGNAVYRDAVLDIKKEVASGIPIHKAMRATEVFQPMVVQMVAIGEESGAVDSMLAKIATIFEAEVDDMVDGLTALLEPLIMAVLGVVIGGLIIAMYLPIFQMGSVV